MRYLFFIISFIFLNIFGGYVWAQDDTDLNQKNQNQNPPLVIRGADIDEVSRIVFDEIPKNAYRAVPLNNILKIVFDDFQYSFLKQDLLAIGLLENIKKLSIDEKDGQTILTIEYSCACQGDFYKWYGKKLVLDVFSLNAIANPLKQKNAAQRKAFEAKKSQEDPKISQEENVQTKEQKAQKLEMEKEIQALKKQQAVQEKLKNKQLNVSESDYAQELKDLVQKANEDGLVDYKNSQRSQVDTKIPLKAQLQKNTVTHNRDEAEDILNSPSQKAVQKSLKNSNNIENIQKMVQKKFEPEPLLPTDKALQHFDGACLPDSTFKLPMNDPHYDNFYDKISDYRNNLVGEFDETDPESALKLAKHYIAYGLGEEALQVLSNFPVPEQRGFIARSMAELLTNRTMSEKSVFKNIDDCIGIQSLWAAYRYIKLGEKEKAATISNFSHAADILKKFPIILQSEIGSKIALNLVRHNSYAPALELVNVLAANTSQFDTSVLLVRGLIDSKNGLQDRAINILENVMDKAQGMDQQMAGLALAELKLASNIDLNERDISILEEIFFLKGRELIGAQALALISENQTRYGNFDMAFKRLSQKTYHNSQIKDPTEIKAEQIFKRIAVSGEANNNPNTMRVYWQYAPLIPKNPVYKEAFAHRLYEQGYDEAALNVIQDIQKENPNYKDNDKLNFLKSKALFRQGKFINVVQNLVIMENLPKFYKHLLAKSYAHIGRHQETQQALSDLKDQESLSLKGSLALQGKNWQDVKKSYDKIENLSEKNELYYRTRASAYMAGHQYSGTANQYKRTEDIIFHPGEKQAKNINNVVRETQKIIELMDQRAEKIQNILHKKQSNT